MASYTEQYAQTTAHHALSATTCPQRRTIGYLAPVILGTDEQRWQGICAAAHDHNLNLICFVGGYAFSPNDFRQIIYKLVPAWLDGLIIGSMFREDTVSTEQLESFFHHFPFPIISIRQTLPGIPYIPLDNYQGMQRGILHLIQAHSARRIVFLRGPQWHPYAQERYQAYVDTLDAQGIPFDARLVSTPAEWRHVSLQSLIDEHHVRPGQDFDAVIGANDAIALNAMRFLRDHEIDVPGDVAVLGFDNNEEGGLRTPSLTTIAPPFYEQGYQAVETLIAMISGETTIQPQAIPAKVVIRESCGCFDAGIKQVLALSVQTVALNAPCDAHTIVADLLATAPCGERSADDLLPCVHAVLDELTGASPGVFLRVLSNVIGRDMAAHRPLREWHSILSGLRQSFASQLTGQQLTQAENLWQQARILIAALEQREQAYQTWQAKQHEAALRDLGQTLITTFDIQRVMDVLARGLPRVGFPAGYIVMYDKPAAAPDAAPTLEWGRLRLAYNEQGGIAVEPEGRRFALRHLLPDDVRAGERRFAWVLMSLNFQQYQSGFVVFEIGPSNGEIYERLRPQISSALYGALLMQRVQEHTAEIERQKALLDSFIETVPDRIWFKDCDGRYIRANRAHASRYGFDDPAQELGKTDFELLNEETARRTQIEESMILRTGEAMANKEVTLVTPDGETRWALVTKMPLRSLHGEIVGTFGISRDITELKQAQADLERAHREVVILNEQLQEENLRMSAELNVARRLQAMILPKAEELRRIEGLDIVGYMQPAEEVGGDYYDVLKARDILHIGIGDVTGHGLESGVLMLMTQTAIRTLIEHGETDPVKFVATLNRTIYKNTKRMNADKTLTFALVNYHNRQLKIVGQHEEVLVVRQTGEIERMDTMSLGFPIGLEAEIAQWVKTATVTLEPGDGIVLYTDGITEAENTDKKMYGLERLCAVITANWHRTAEEIKQAVISDVLQFIGQHTVYDDLTLVVLKQT